MMCSTTTSPNGVVWLSTHTLGCSPCGGLAVSSTAPWMSCIAHHCQLCDFRALSARRHQTCTHRTDRCHYCVNCAMRSRYVSWPVNRIIYGLTAKASIIMTWSAGKSILLKRCGKGGSPCCDHDAGSTDELIWARSTCDWPCALCHCHRKH